MMHERTYRVPARGMASSFTESEIPANYALRFRNRFLNAAGGAEKRQGLIRKGAAVPGQPQITGLHELVQKDGTQLLFGSGGGSIFLFDDVTETWSAVETGLPLDRIQSVQMNDKLIFINGTSRPFYTEDGATFTDLKALIEKGQVGSTVSSTTLDDADIDDWIADTFVTVDDLVHNITNGGYGIITAVNVTALTHTAINSSATGLGKTLDVQKSGDRYEIIDLVELNVIPTDGDPDNVAETGPGTTATTIAVSGVNFATTEIRPGDFIFNTTRSAVAMVSAVATALTVTSIASQVAGDSISLHKSAMPIAKRAHVHYGRLYLIDARDERKVRVSGPEDPQDMTVAAGTLEGTTFRSGALQPTGDIIVDMTSYQKFFVLAGKRNIYFYEGTDPIQDVSANTVDFSPVALFPQGVIGAGNVVSIGNDVAFVTPDGLQAASYAGSNATLGRTNISQPIKQAIRDAITAASPTDIQLINYQKRAWLMVKTGTQMYVFNYIDQLNEQARVIGDLPDQNKAAWHVFDGKFARLDCYLVRQDQTLVCGGAAGLIYEFDQNTHDDDGEIYTTELQTNWLGLDETKGAILGSTKVKDVKYIRPSVNAGQNVSYSIRAEAPFNQSGFEEVTFEVSGGAAPIGVAKIGAAPIGSQPVTFEKIPVRVRGERVRFTFTTDDDSGPDVLGDYTVYFNVFGVR